MSTESLYELSIVARRFSFDGGPKHVELTVIPRAWTVGGRGTRQIEDLDGPDAERWGRFYDDMSAVVDAYSWAMGTATRAVAAARTDARELMHGHTCEDCGDYTGQQMPDGCHPHDRGWPALSVPVEHGGDVQKALRTALEALYDERGACLAAWTLPTETAHDEGQQR